MELRPSRVDIPAPPHQHRSSAVEGSDGEEGGDADEEVAAGGGGEGTGCGEHEVDWTAFCVLLALPGSRIQFSGSFI